MDFITSTFPQAIPSYPPMWSMKVRPYLALDGPSTTRIDIPQQHLFRRTIYSWIADNLCDYFVEPMREMSFEDLDALAASFKFENCQQRTQLVEVLKKGA